MIHGDSIYLESIMITDDDFNLDMTNFNWVCHLSTWQAKGDLQSNIAEYELAPDQSSIWHKTASEVGSVHCWSWLKAPGQSIAYTSIQVSDSDCSCKFYNGALFPICHFCNPIIITYLWCFQPLPVSLSFHITHISWQKYFHLQIYKSYSSFSILYFDTDNTVR